jgi:ABC-type multidrug transport system ATPase subunit
MLVNAIEVVGLRKQYRRLRGGATLAVDGLDLQVAEGEVFGFLGPNGAGKTTTIRLLLGLLRADAGVAWVLGERVPCPRRLGEIGAIVEEPAFYPWLSGRRNLLVVAGTGPPVPDRAVDAALERAGLAEAADLKVKAYSQGMRQRLGLAAALLRSPRLLILDEPANGLDPAGIREFRTLLRGLGDEGATVFLSSHLLGEVEQVCDRVAVVDRGRLVQAGTVSELGRGEERVRVLVASGEQQAALALLDGLQTRVDGPGVLLVRGATGRQVNQALAQGGVYAESVVVERAGLEERFLAITRGEGNGAPAPR